MLNLPEELFLLSISDDKGTVHSSAKDILGYGLAGALLADLALEGKLVLDEKKRLVVLDATPTGDSILDEALERIQDSPKKKNAQYWVDALSGKIKKFQKRMAEKLVEKGIVAVEERRLLWIIPYEAYPQQDASAKYWIKQSLRTLVLAGEKPEAHTLALLSLVKACRLLDFIFTRDERKAARKYIDQLLKSEVFGPAVTQVIEDIESAASAAVIATMS
jgi:Golgi phosphoprotein 3